MIRLAAACVGLGVMCVLSTLAAGTVWSVPLSLGLVVFAVWLVFREDRAMGDLELFERREAARENRFVCGDPEGDWIRDLKDAS